MKKKWTIILLIILLGGIAGASFGLYMWYKPVEKVAKMKTAYSLPASELYDAFENNEISANESYLNQVIEVTGIVRELKLADDGEPALVFETNDMLFGVMCDFESAKEVKDISVGDLITIKGICTGKALDVVLNRCILIN